jgi:hypothetical protein
MNREICDRCWAAGQFLNWRPYRLYYGPEGGAYFCCYQKRLAKETPIEDIGEKCLYSLEQKISEANE